MRFWLYVALVTAVLVVITWIAKRSERRRAPGPMSQDWLAKARGNDEV